MGLLYFVLCAWGLTQILVYGKIFEVVRPEHYFFKCTMCMGFWVGLILFLLNGTTTLFNFDYTMGNAFVLSCISSATSYALSTVFGDCGISVNYTGTKN